MVIALDPDTLSQLKSFHATNCDSRQYYFVNLTQGKIILSGVVIWYFSSKMFQIVMFYFKCAVDYITCSHWLISAA